MMSVSSSSSSSQSSSGESRSVEVHVRVRPLLGEEQGVEDVVCVRVPAGASSAVDVSDGRASHSRFSFGRCFGESASQEDVFSHSVQPFLDSLFQGINTTVFAYGMTGSGKTHTMQGTAVEPGVIPQSIEYIFKAKQQLEAERGSKLPALVLKMSYLEIYNEKVYDLLDPKERDLPVREDQERNIFISSLHEAPIRSVKEFRTLYEQGCRNRKTAETKLNATSSRSHAVLMIKVVFRESQAPHRLLSGKLHLIDLAGSEDNRRTGNTGLRLTESSNINSSLFVLGKVVNALNSKEHRIPYRDSKLTRLLQDSLGGNSQAVMICNVAPSLRFFWETTNTLHFASKARQVVNTPIVHAESCVPFFEAPSACPLVGADPNTSSSSSLDGSVEGSTGTAASGSAADDRKARLLLWKQQKGKQHVGGGSSGGTRGAGGAPRSGDRVPPSKSLTAEDHLRIINRNVMLLEKKWEQQKALESQRRQHKRQQQRLAQMLSRRRSHSSDEDESGSDWEDSMSFDEEDSEGDEFPSIEKSPVLNALRRRPGSADTLCSSLGCGKPLKKIPKVEEKAKFRGGAQLVHDQGNRPEAGKSAVIAAVRIPILGTIKRNGNPAAAGAAARNPLMDVSNVLGGRGHSGGDCVQGSHLQVENMAPSTKGKQKSQKKEGKGKKGGSKKEINTSSLIEASLAQGASMEKVDLKLRELMVTLNTGDEKALVKIPQVGKKIAKNIVAFREEPGSLPFTQIEDLLKVGVKSGNLSNMWCNLLWNWNA